MTRFFPPSHQLHHCTSVVSPKSTKYWRGGQAKSSQDVCDTFSGAHGMLPLANFCMWHRWTHSVPGVLQLRCRHTQPSPSWKLLSKSLRTGKTSTVLNGNIIPLGLKISDKLKTKPIFIYLLKKKKSFLIQPSFSQSGREVRMGGFPALVRRALDIPWPRHGSSLFTRTDNESPCLRPLLNE